MKTHTLLPALIALFYVTGAQAGLVMNVDVNTKEIFFKGSGITSPTAVGNAAIIYDNNYGSNGGGDTFRMTSGISASGGRADYLLLYVNSSGKLRLANHLKEITESSVIMTGTGNRMSYASQLFEPLHQVFENYRGGSLSHSWGPSASPITVNVIPEPMTAAFILFALTLFVIRRNVSASTKRGTRKLYMHLNTLFSQLYIRPIGRSELKDRWIS